MSGSNGFTRALHRTILCALALSFTYTAAAHAAINGFEGGDGDQVATCMGSSDWMCLSVSMIETALDPTGAGDDSFADGSKETHPDGWTYGTGAVQAKADLLAAWASVSSGSGARTFLDVAFARAGANGDTYVGIELNQTPASWVNSAGSTVPCRTDGDVLVSFAASNQPAITLHRWDGNGGPASCPDGRTGTWFESTSLQQAFEAGLNGGPIVNHLNTSTLGDSLAARTFGEASLDLGMVADVLQDELPGGCSYFRHMSVKTRSAAELGSALQDWATGSDLFARSCETPTGADLIAPGVPTLAAPASSCTLPLAISGTGEPGSTVTVYDGGVTPVGFATVDSAGAWHLSLPALADGVHSLSAEATDTAGNTSVRSQGISVAVDATAPAAPVLQATWSDQNTVVVSGTAEPGREVAILEDGATLATVTAAADGTFSTTLDVGPSGHTFVATVSDACRTSAASAPAVVPASDVTAPSAPILTAPASSCALPVIVSGTAEPGLTITLYDGTSSLGSTTADSTGDWGMSIASLSDGEHSLTAEAADAAGNVSARSAAATVTVDVAAPSAPTLQAERVDEGFVKLSGTAEVGLELIVREGDAVVATITVGDDGTFTARVAGSQSGQHVYLATAADECRTSQASAPATVAAITGGGSGSEGEGEGGAGTEAPTPGDGTIPAIPAAPSTAGGSTAGTAVSATDDLLQVAFGTRLGAGQCMHKAFRAYVPKKNLRSAVFRVDGKTVAVARKPDRAGFLFTVIDPAKYGPGAHKLTARVTFRKRGKRPVTLTLRFRRCDECQSRRSFRIRVPHLRDGERAVRARVYVNGRRVQVVTGKRLRASVVLTGLPRGKYNVKILTWTNRGRLHKSTRRYRTCVPKSKPPTKKVTSRG